MIWLDKRQIVQIFSLPAILCPCARRVLGDGTMEHNIERRQTDGLITIFGAGRLNLFVRLNNLFAVESPGLTSSVAIAAGHRAIAMKFASPKALKRLFRAATKRGRDERLIARSGLFDEPWYLANNPDAAHFPGRSAAALPASWRAGSCATPTLISIPPGIAKTIPTSTAPPVEPSRSLS